MHGLRPITENIPCVAACTVYWLDNEAFDCPHLRLAEAIISLPLFTMSCLLRCGFRCAFLRLKVLCVPVKLASDQPITNHVLGILISLQRGYSYDGQVRDWLCQGYSRPCFHVPVSVAGNYVLVRSTFRGSTRPA